MPKLLPLLSLSFLLTVSCFGQFGGLVNKARNKVSQRIDRKIDQSIDKALDRAEGKDASASGSDKATTANTSSGNNTPSATNAHTATLSSYSRYDFVPGETVLYAEDFAAESLGELPTAWNSSGSAEVVTLEKTPGRWLRLHKAMAYLTANKTNFGADYTIEFDLLLQLKNNGWMYPQFIVSTLASRDLSPDDNGLLKDYRQFAAATTTIAPFEHNASRAIFEAFREKASSFKGDLVNIGAIEKGYGQPMHIAIQVQQQRYRCWINDLKVLDVPKGVPVTDTMNQLRFEVGATNYPEEGYGIYISNLRIASGLPDTRHKLIDEGRFTTNGIGFDPNSATIRPESSGVLKEIAAALAENPGVRVLIVGHTSSDGTAAANLGLSQQRAAAVKEVLTTEYKISADRIETDGKGQSEPVADNKTKEGRARNRRVDFIKL